MTDFAKTKVIKEKLGVTRFRDKGFSATYNLAPSQDVRIIRLPADHEKEILPVHWGLVPFWAKDVKVGYKMINARAETIAEKPSYKNLLGKKRCLVIASGFFEWKKIGRSKYPYYIHMASGDFMTFAGLWDSWKDKDGKILESCTIVTCAPNETVAHLHDRMPVIITGEDRDLWLDTDKLKKEEALKLLRPLPAKLIDMHPVTNLINSPANNAEEYLQPALHPDADPALRESTQVKNSE